MPRAIWKDTVIAEAADDAVKIVEGNIYFPQQAVRREFLAESDTVTTCPWKGAANYYHVVVKGETNRDAAWTYHAPLEAAKQITDHVAFWRGVEVQP
jgi:uncharacterized protein (DUF427 family)